MAFSFRVCCENSSAFCVISTVYPNYHLHDQPVMISIKDNTSPLVSTRLFLLHHGTWSVYMSGIYMPPAIALIPVFSAARSDGLVESLHDNS